MVRMAIQRDHDRPSRVQRQGRSLSARKGAPRVRTAWMLFQAARSRSRRRGEENLSGAAMWRVAAGEWRRMSHEEKAPFQAGATWDEAQQSLQLRCDALRETGGGIARFFSRCPQQENEVQKPIHEGLRQTRGGIRRYCLPPDVTANDLCRTSASPVPAQVVVGNGSLDDDQIVTTGETPQHEPEASPCSHEVDHNSVDSCESAVPAVAKLSPQSPASASSDASPSASPVPMVALASERPQLLSRVRDLAAAAASVAIPSSPTAPPTFPATVPYSPAALPASRLSPTVLATVPYSPTDLRLAPDVRMRATLLSASRLSSPHSERSHLDLSPELGPTQMWGEARSRSASPSPPRFPLREEQLMLTPERPAGLERIGSPLQPAASAPARASDISPTLSLHAALNSPDPPFRCARVHGGRASLRNLHQRGTV